MPKAYHLIARKGARKSVRAFQAIDEGAAMLHSIGIVLNQSTDDDLWARGEIELREAEGGKLINRMPEKGDI